MLQLYSFFVLQIFWQRLERNELAFSLINYVADNKNIKNYFYAFSSTSFLYLHWFLAGFWNGISVDIFASGVELIIAPRFPRLRQKQQQQQDIKTIKSNPQPIQRTILPACDWEFHQSKNAKINTIYMHPTLHADNFKMFFTKNGSTNGSLIFSEQL